MYSYVGGMSDVEIAIDMANVAEVSRGPVSQTNDQQMEWLICPKGQISMTELEKKNETHWLIRKRG